MTRHLERGSNLDARRRSTVRAWLGCAVAVWLLASCASGSTGKIVGVEAFTVTPNSTALGFSLATCNADHEIVEVDESDPGFVVVTIKTTGGFDDDCADGIAVELAQPVGERIVIDGHNDEPVAILQP